MADFLHGGRRKIGLVILGMALLLTMGWFRSMVIYDEFWTEVGGDCFVARSVQGDFEIHRGIGLSFDWMGEWYHHHRYTPEDDRELIYSSLTPNNEQWRRSLAGFSIRCFTDKSKISNRHGDTVPWYIIRGPYWELILISTLIAAALILPRPRRTTRRPNDAPPSVTSTARSSGGVRSEADGPERLRLP